MDLGKIIRLIGILVAVVAPFTDLPQEGAAIALLGVVGGYFIEEEYSQRFLIGALALALAHGALEPLWYVGESLTTILSSVSALFNAAACTVIVVGLVKRLAP